MNNPPGNTKPMNDVVFDKIDHIEVLTSISGIVSAHFEK